MSGASTQPSDVARELTSAVVRPPSHARPPVAAGFYAWWCRSDHLSDAEPPFPLEHRPPVDLAWSLLYVGISPSSASSSRNIAARFAKDHVGGNIGGSTFRQSLAAMLMESLQLRPRPGSDRSRLVSEVPLSRWIADCCGMTFARVDRPWELERDVIALMNPPLNLSGATHPFAADVSERRRALRSACVVG